MVGERRRSGMRQNMVMKMRDAGWLVRGKCKRHRRRDATPCIALSKVHPLLRISHFALGKPACRSKGK